MGSTSGSQEQRPLDTLTPRQQELIRVIQGLSPDRRYTLKIVCRGREPWEVQEVIEHHKLDDLKPKPS